MFINEQEALEILGSVGAVLTDGHFINTSWKHGSAYVKKDNIYPHTQKISAVCEAMVAPYSILERMTEVVAAPAIGGIILSQWGAHHLSRMQGNETLAVFAEPNGNSDEFIFKRDYAELVRGKRVLVVEDILNTGGSAKKVVRAVRVARGHVVGIAAICNRGGVTRESLNVPRLSSLIHLLLEAVDEKDCLLCQKGVPVNTNVGHGREFLARKQP